MTDPRTRADMPPSPVGAPDVAAVKAWLVAYLANLLEFERDEVRTNLPLGRYGLDSTAGIALMGDLSDWLRCEIDPTLLYDYKSIDALAGYIAANHPNLRKPGK